MLTPEQKKGASGTCPVKRIKADNEQGFTEINEHDFDPAKGHEPYVEQAAEVEPKDMNVKQLKAHLKGLGIEFSAKASREDLLALVPAAE